ncbi:MAG: hypothetical protein GWO20_08860 [Candidatus Korarchaeota archaeon]|nr:hypothetical protein [Candidatus Korarchaeota archaeon]
MHPDRIIAETDKHGTGEVFTLVTPSKFVLFYRTFEDLTSIMVGRSCTLSTVTKTSMAFIVYEFIDTNTAI